MMRTGCCIVFSLLVLLPNLYGTQLPQTKTVIVHVERNPLFDFSVARGQFADAVEEFRKGFWIDKDRKKAAKKMEDNIDSFLRYIRSVSTDRATFEPGDLAKMTNAQLSAETLTSAQQLQGELQRLVKEAYRAVIPVSHWEFLYKVEGDLLRLKWMSSRLG